MGENIKILMMLCLSFFVAYVLAITSFYLWLVGGIVIFALSTFGWFFLCEDSKYQIVIKRRE